MMDNVSKATLGLEARRLRKPAMTGTLRNAALLVALALLVCLVSAGGWLYATGLWGMTAFLLVLLVWIALIVSTERQQASAR